MTSQEWSLNSRIKRRSFLKEIITSRNQVFKDFESDMAVGITKLGNPTGDTAEINDTIQQTAGS
jgi:hypothetical protein